MSPDLPPQPQGSLLENLIAHESDMEAYKRFEQAMVREHHPFISMKVTPKIDKPGIPSAYELAERRAKLQKSHDSLQREMEQDYPSTPPPALSPQAQYEKLLLDYFSLIRKLESISVAMNTKGVALSFHLAQKVIERARSLHGNAEVAYRKLRNCYKLNSKHFLRRESVLPDGPKSVKEYLPAIRIIDAHPANEFLKP
jgi:hypothetical protein